MSEKVDIFGVKFDVLTTGEITEIIAGTIKTADKNCKPLVVFTPNPEIVMAAQKNKQLFFALELADIICADGVGIVWASKYFGKRIKERASGYDVVMELFSISVEKGGISAFFYGGTEEVVTKAAVKMQEKFKGLFVSGVKNGYEKESCINIINESGADILLVGLGSPKQELWVTENISSLKVKVIMVVGGSFDVMSGNLKRAPIVMRKFGLEWLYRLVTQPKRLFRMLNLPRFVLAVLFRRVKK